MKPRFDPGPSMKASTAREFSRERICAYFARAASIRCWVASTCAVTWSTSCCWASTFWTAAFNWLWIAATCERMLESFASAAS